jgi:hypothetical protein
MEVIFTCPFFEKGSPLIYIAYTLSGLCCCGNTQCDIRVQQSFADPILALKITSSFPQLVNGFFCCSHSKPRWFTLSENISLSAFVRGSIIFRNVMVKVTPWDAYAGTDGRRRCSSKKFAALALEFGAWSTPLPGRFDSGKDPVICNVGTEFLNKCTRVLGFREFWSLKSAVGSRIL